MTVAETVVVDGARLRLRPWRGRSDVAELTPVRVGAVLSVAAVRAGVEHAHTSGYERIVTPALPTIELAPYLDVGFVVADRLHLLVHDLQFLVPPSRTVPLRRATQRDLAGVLTIDHRAFQPFWRLDREALADAIRATPSTRYRVDRSDTVGGYAIVGRSGSRGYVQRLAVDPGRQGQGLGHALLHDGLRWLKRWRVREVLVNTQETNERALDLYRRTGFRQRVDGLTVVQYDLRAR